MNEKMNENKKVVVNLTEGTTQAEVTVREGAATKVLDPKAPIKIDIRGVIGAPVEFLDKRLSEEEQINPKRCHVIVDRANITITLVTSEDDDYHRGQITGVLEEHPKFKEFGINAKKIWEPNELGQFFKMNRAFFPDKEKNMKLVTELKNFEATINSKIEKQKSEKGDFKDNYSGVVLSNLPEAFSLRIPIFKGAEAEIIEVEFYASVNGRDVGLHLFSPGACQLLEDLRDKVIDGQIAKIRELSPEIAIIEQ
ncbi:MAG: hypothetical protein LBS69_07750 [Prevotellaceae bacterium]|jgi:hypothetical protein|nr:hypothetical protein [Prevotellaceae bacterium]